MIRNKFYVRVVKPFFDTICAFIFIFLLLPILIIVGGVVAIDLRKNPLFTQLRVGKDEKTFRLFKIRTMRVDNDHKTMTRLGKFLRSISVDELPQLINVLKGEMSFIGPRPLLIAYLPHYNLEEKKRHWVKPGMTGWAQVNGRNEIDWEKKMETDVFYVKNISISLDIRILFLTILELSKRDKTVYENGRIITFTEYASKR